MTKLNNNIQDLEKFLKGKKWLKPDEKILSAEKPGEGNMNFTLRIKTVNRSFIIKQSRDYVEKYPQVAAPEERVLREAGFYELTAKYPDLKAKMPKLLDLDKSNHVMLLEDLGEGTDYTFLYKKGKNLGENELQDLMDFAANLHKEVTTETTKIRLANRKMRELNYEHIFEYPYIKDNGINLDEILPDLGEIGEVFKNDKPLQSKLKELGKLYLADGKHLLHGDYFPGSWLKTVKGLKIIDPEFCFFGCPEFEMGVFFAHLKMADQPEDVILKAQKFYTEKRPLDEILCEKFTAVEILRRILGLAQLPLEIGLEKRKTLVFEAQDRILA